MKNLKKSAKTELLQLTSQLKANKKTLNHNEFISVLNEMKSIVINKQFVEIAIQSLKVLNQTKVKHKGKLTNREEEILELIGKGLQNSSIAKQLNLSKSTIETHRKNIRKKLKLNGTDNLFVYALLFNLQNHNLITYDNS
ncbi:LuxR C-terminal-related transcriptional regulator [uncultured Winogradskyella sp.]|uniref:response regulator transcription factor n=1 Tax=uncultured Winogradskyella sp. TaxID=395353 RepID=UPI00261E29D4|nr:LuxR C-terminal-related transcriptional regulator [uncultured Winogradskyella sp.]